MGNSLKGTTRSIPLIVFNGRTFIRAIVNRLKTIILPLMVAILVVALALAQTAHAEKASELSRERQEATKIKVELKELNSEKEALEAHLREETEKSKRLKRDNDRLKANLQAKRDNEAALAREAEQRRTIAPAPKTTISGDKHSWLAASGIPKSDWEYVDYIVSRESGWNPNAVNPTSGACGLGQQLPCGKWSGAWNDPVAALKAQYGYVKGRYGSYKEAYNFWLANRWY